MTTNALRRGLVVVIVAIITLAFQHAVQADQCRLSCTSGHPVCSMQAMAAAKGCLQDCAADPTNKQCKLSCMTSFRDTRKACRASRTDCMTNCPAVPSVSGDACTGDCGSVGKSCFGGTFDDGKRCVDNCISGVGPGAELATCLTRCAAALRGSGAACLAHLQGCLAECSGPVSGACFDTIAMQCTTEACGPDQPCTQPNQFCSPRCSTTPPSGVCFNSSSMECTQVACSSAQPCPSEKQSCVPECPILPPTGRCVDPATNQCTDQPCGPGRRCAAENLKCTLQCPPPPPPPTQAPPCSAVPCGGQCVINPPCPNGEPCSKRPSFPGQCAIDASGACQCVPASPPPTPTRPVRPTPTPQCADVPCGGRCLISVPCPNGEPCPEAPVRIGQCTSDSSTGTCQCVPFVPPTQPPKPTPTPQCSGLTCGGACLLAPNCPNGTVCPDFVVRGECRTDSAGECQCVPAMPPTPKPTPQTTPKCATDADCADNSGCTADRCVEGRCEHACLCVRAADASCCPGPAAFCVRPCGADAAGSCGGACPFGTTCESQPNTATGCGCVSEEGGPCGGNILNPRPVCADGLVCKQVLPDIVGVCVKPQTNCIPFFAPGCSQTSDCCEPCGHAPCAVCIGGTCVGAP